MYDEMIDKINEIAKRKSAVLNESLPKYLLSSAYAGAYVGLAIILIYSIGGYLEGAVSTRVVMGLSFAISLTLVVFTGTDLFTGNTFVMTVGTLTKSTKVSDLAKIWFFSFLGNFIGATVISLIYVNSGLVDEGSVMKFFESIALAKANASFLELFCRGILCNILVCLAIMIGYRTTDDTAKILVIFMCLFAFITSSYEHSVANMTLYSVAIMSNGIKSVTVSTLIQNIVPVTLGNIFGGSLFLGAGAYALKSKNYNADKQQ